MELSLFTLFLTITAVSAQSGCDGGVRSPNRDKCYHVYTKLSFHADAETFCKTSRPGGSLASFTTAFEEVTVNNFLVQKGFSCANLWIGASNLNGDFSWTDGTPFFFTKWGSGEPRNGQFCATMKTADNLWTTDDCKKSLQFLCISDVSTTIVTPQPTIPPVTTTKSFILPITSPSNSSVACQTPCESGWTWFERTSACYRVIKETIKFIDAVELCKRVGGQLASIHSNDENTFVNELAMTGMPMDGQSGSVWIGMKLNANKQRSWVDGTPVDYENFKLSEPNGSGMQCVHIYPDPLTSMQPSTDSSTYIFSWNDTGCADRNMRASVCKRPARPIRK